MNENQSAKGKGYDNPKYWSEPAEVGDIYQVIPSEVENNSAYVLGDFYIALRAGTLDYYPDFGKNTGDWKHAWARCVDQQLVTPSFGHDAAIYANGRHCAAIDFFFTPQDAEGRTITHLPSGYFQEVLSKYGSDFNLINYSGDPLPTGIVSSTRPTEYSAIIPNSQQSGDKPTGTSCFTLYVSSSAPTDVQLGIKLVTADGNALPFSETEIPIVPVTLETLSPQTYDVSTCSVDDETGNDDQYTNKYLRPHEAGFAFVKSEKISGGLQKDVFGHSNQYTPSNEMAQWVGDVNGSVVSVCTLYYWDIAPKPQTRDHLGYSGTITATTNDRAGSLNVTTVSERSEYTGVTGEVDSSCKFTVYDQFGNTATFGVALASDHIGATFVDA
jgi:hypothetical protein